MLEKTELRKKVSERLKQLSSELYIKQSEKIADYLYQEECWRSANTIGITISRPPEVDTYAIIRKAWGEGKRVVVPKCIPKGRKMDFRILENFDQLESVYFGLLEPIESQTIKIEPELIDLLFVPGLAYSNDGYRLGFGGGYYDRFLTHYKGNTISLAFHQQMVSVLPIEDHDLPVKKMITDIGSLSI
ncbi:5-formyltetrahydrofolate cyclo-ligase [Niallia sp. Krafla_26]|uniref:5-formyltetrahydrofolate cyclo-ligase n=1 Tax=Niallia sp. Krafla_26 TaxID=3064703 RepID=UPI003D16DB5E